MFSIRPIEEKDRSFTTTALKNLWGSEKMAIRGTLIDVSPLDGFLAEDDGRIVGLVTYLIENNSCDITSLNALTPGKGIGTAFIEEVKKTAKEHNCLRLTVITTNDNTKALHFYQKRGFVISALFKDIMKEERKLKPEIPLTGEDGIPLRDEIELEMQL